MEFNGFKIDLQALAVLVTAITAGYMAIKGVRMRDKKKKERQDDGVTGEGND